MTKRSFVFTLDNELKNLIKKAKISLTKPSIKKPSLEDEFAAFSGIKKPSLEDEFAAFSGIKKPSLEDEFAAFSGIKKPSLEDEFAAFSGIKKPSLEDEFAAFSGIKKPSLEDEFAAFSGIKKPSLEDEFAAFKKPSLEDEFLQFSNKSSNWATTPTNPHQAKILPPVPELKEKDLLITTKTQSMFISLPVDITQIFWEIPVISFSARTNGVVKKQIKITSKTKEEYEAYQVAKQKIPSTQLYVEKTNKHFDNEYSTGKKFEDVRTISVGICKKEIVTTKKKGNVAFSNCFVVYVRYKYNHVFFESHVKVFNTGTIEVTGMPNYLLMNSVCEIINSILQPHYLEKLVFQIDSSKDARCVLINSGFSSRFNINRQRLKQILLKKYKIRGTLVQDYPGLKCAYYFNTFDDVADQNGQVAKEDCGLTLDDLKKSKKYIVVNYMVFRTGQCLISGHCSERMIYHVFKHLTRILIDEYTEIYVPSENTPMKKKSLTTKRKCLFVNQKYHTQVIKKGNCVPFGSLLVPTATLNM